MARREGLFPTGSIGRSGIPVPRTGSFEGLTAHPLLSPSPTSSNFSSAAPPASGSSSSALGDPAPAVPPKYVPYTPRQRGAPLPATTTPATGTTSQPTHPDRDAANRLQLMNLKAAAQKAGLDAASTGWMILERFALEVDRAAEWNDLWNAVTDGKATLLLPKDPHPSNVSVTPEFIKDHIAFCDAGAGSRVTSVITLSGLRGSITDNVLTIRSTLPPSSKPFQALLSPATRASAFTSLAPLPKPLSPPPHDPADAHPRRNSKSAPSYPAFPVHAHASSLPLPPRPASLAKGPPLPPRPTARPAPLATPSPAAVGPRLSNPFASLFGRATPAPASPPASPTAAAAALPPAESPSAPPATASAPGPAEHAAPLSVPAYVLAGRVQRAQVLREISGALRGEVEAALAAADVPAFARERVLERTWWMAPVAYGSAGAAPAAAAVTSGTRRVSGHGRGAGGSDGSAWEMAVDLLDAVDGGGIDEVARRVQEFMYDLEEELEKGYDEEQAREKEKGRMWTRRGQRGSGSEGEPEGEKESLHETEEQVSKHDDDEDTPKSRWVNSIMEAVEKTVCSLFYDRLFLPRGTDDGSHDEALSSRIAAVNLLDLGLAHLGVEVGLAGREVDSLIKACGKTLMQLDAACRSPADKAATLVAVHKILVEGLSRLPPLRLKSEDEILDDKTPMASSFGQDVHPEDEDLEADRAVSPPPAVVVSPIEESDRPLEPAAENASLLSDDSARSASPILTVSPPPETPSTASAPTPVSGDIILPLMIFAVVKANPPHLVSHLLYTQRFRREKAAGGEEGYCLINLMAVAEFLENVDLAALGLGDSEKMVISTAELTPIPFSRPGSDGGSPRVSASSLRGRVEQQVDALAGSANKVLTGVVDTSFGVLRALLPGQTLTVPGAAPAPHLEGVATPPIDGTQGAAPWNAPQPRFGLLRRDTGFSIASIAASLPGRAKTPAPGEEGQQMVDVPSRPGSSRSMGPGGEEEEDEESEDGEEDDDDDEYEEEDGHDARSIRSFESMMSRRSRQARRRKSTGAASGTGASGRKSLADRLASVPGLGRLSHGAQGESCAKASPPTSRPTSLLVPSYAAPKVIESPIQSRSQSPISIRIAPPNSRFMTCAEDDLRVSEVGELLREYRRLVETVRAMGGFGE
ncbi:uncharacterized protein BXZ73DRAFT_51674 [Epithele typhae]|uniref:uncharacterized protein n=1 Tax=Epithele typhae TaxID=378194 RepID=UPI002008A89B|nr:uncharacterized protein BXZ73DRAFT_51674 [Epithele typhae]KAH9921737.1 hypothetical protein BXZ73DRAFT_51674 [Epithele typhae]